MSWADGPMLGFDLETTGLDVNCHRIVQYALVLHRPGRDPLRVSSIVNPGCPIPQAAAAVHGISTERAKAEGQRSRQALAILLAGIGQTVARGWPVVAMNGCYDLTLRDRELRRRRFLTVEQYVPGAELRMVDPLVLDRHLDRYRKTKAEGGRTLTNLARHYGVQQGTAHDALGDGETTLRLVPAIAARYPQIAAMSLDELHAFQQSAHAVWADHMNDYLADQPGENEPVERHWPLVPSPAADEAEWAATDRLLTAISTRPVRQTRPWELSHVTYPAPPEPGIAFAQ